MRFKVAARAERQIRAAAAWWTKHRVYAPQLFAEELEAAFNLIERFPHAGEPVPHRKLAGIRRVLLHDVQYHVYYRIHADAQVVEILALRHSSRGGPPRLS